MEQQRRQEQLAKMVPPGINTEQLEYANGTILFRFSHEELGQIALVPFMVPPGQCHVSAEILSSDPDEDEHWDEKYRLFETMGTLCVSVLPGEQMMRSSLAPLPVAKEQQRLYQRFTRSL